MRPESAPRSPVMMRRLASQKTTSETQLGLVSESEGIAPGV